MSNNPTYGITPDGFSFVEWYRDDDGNSGFGDNSRIARWYGSALACRKMLKRKSPPIGCKWVSAGEYGELYRSLAE